MWTEQPPVSTRNTCSFLILQQHFNAKDWPTFPRSFLTASAMSLRLSEMKRSRLFSWWILNSRGLVLPVWKDFLARCTTSCSRDILNFKQTNKQQQKKTTSSTRAKCCTAQSVNQSKFYQKLMNATARANGVSAWRTQNSRAWGTRQEHTSFRSVQQSNMSWITD